MGQCCDCCAYWHGHTIDTEIAAHPGQTGAYILDTGESALRARAWLADHARHSIEVQYFIWSSDNVGILATEALLRAADRGVKVRILTSSLASTDNMQAFSGYRNQRWSLLKMGLDIYEYKPDPANRASLVSRVNASGTPPVFALHAKSMVVDGQVAYIGTFNFDPRSENLNTEVGAIIRHPGFAQRLQTIMEADMRPENSWHAADDRPQYVPLTGRGQARLWQLLPLKPLL